jgi:hypothetical protein
MRICRSQLSLALHFILRFDFPENFPGFIDMVGQYVQQSNSPNCVYGGLIALHEAVKLFQYKPSKERGPLNRIVKVIFPFLRQIGHDLVHHEGPDAASVVKIVCKTYFNSVQYELSRSHMDPSNLSSWCQFFLDVLNKNCLDGDVASLDDDEMEERSKNPWWKAKKWSMRCLNKFMSRYSNSKLDTYCGNNKRYGSFSKMFMNQYSGVILQSYLHIANQYMIKKAFVSPQCRYLLSCFFADCVQHNSTWNVIHPLFSQLLNDWVLPCLAISSGDLRLWEEDPVEYIHAKKDPLDDFLSPAAGGKQLLMALINSRRSATLEPTLALIHQTLAIPTDINSSPLKDGAMHMLSLIADGVLDRRSSSSIPMESTATFLVQYVFPELSSPIHFLRARALSTVAAFSKINYTETHHAVAAFVAAFNSLALSTGPSDLPIRVEAALALRPMIANDNAREAMVPHIGAVMHALLDIQNAIEMDTLAGVMEELVEVFSEQVAPFAVELAKQLCSTFVRIMDDAQAGLQPAENGGMLVMSRDEDDDDGFDFDAATDKTMAAMGVLKTVQTLVLSVDGSQEIMWQLESAISPALLYVLDNRVVDLYSDVFELIDSCTYSVKSISDTMWSLFEKLHFVARSDGIDYICDMFPAIDNYLSYGSVKFASDPRLQEMTFEIARIVMTFDDLAEPDRVAGCQIMESMLLNLRGSVDHLILPFLSLTVGFLAVAIRTSQLRVACLNVVLNCIYYAPVLTFSILQEHNWMQMFLNQWNTNISKFTRVHDRKVSLLAIFSILKLSESESPELIRCSLPQLMHMVATLFAGLPKAEKARAEQEKYFSGIEEADDCHDFPLEQSEEYIDHESQVSDDQDNEWEDEDEDEESGANGWPTDASAVNNADCEDNDDDDDDEELMEELYYESPLDSVVDVYVQFAELFTSIQQIRPDLYHGLTGSLSPEDQTVMMEVVRLAAERQQA